jgi:hypothetical protein
MGFLSLIARLSLNASGFESGLKRSQSLATRWSRDVSSNVKGQLAAAFGAGAVLAATKNAIDYAGKINDISSSLGVGTDALQEFDFAATQNGAHLEDFVGVMRKLAIARQNAIDKPEGDLAEDFHKLGVSIDDLKSKRLEDLVKQIGTAFKDARDPQQLLDAGLATMGRGALSVLPAMRNGLDEAAESAHNLGLVISESAIEKLDELGDRFDVMKGKMRSALGEGASLFAKWADTAMSSLNWAIGGAATYWGARAGGASHEEAGAAAKAFGDEIIAKDITAEAEMQRRKNQRKDLANAAAGISEKAASPATFRTFVPGLTTEQHAGAFTAAVPVITEQRRSNQLLQRIEQNTRNKGEHDSLFS